MLIHKISFITCLLISFTTLSFSQSGWINYSPNSSMYFTSVDFVDLSTGYVLDMGCFVLKTTNAGVNWVQICGLINDVNDIDFIDEQTGYICGDTYCSIMKTTNSGYNWQIMALYPAYIYDIDFLNSNTGYAVGESGYILKTTNAGNNWVQLTFQQNDVYNSIQIINSSVMFLSGTRILRTSNNGINWIDISPVPSYYWNLYFVNINTGYVLQLNKAYKTTDSGSSWILIRNDGNMYRGIYFSDISTGYICGGNGDILKTTNGGTNWQIQINNLEVSLRNLYFNNANTGFCVGNYGTILKTTNGGEPIGIQPISSEIPIHFSLSQNYPNPFNPVTKIKFDTPPQPSPKGREQWVRLVIYDILGREITTLVNEQLKPGSYEVSWDGSNYPSGVYFYRLIAADASSPPANPLSIIKKMILLK